MKKTALFSAFLIVSLSSAQNLHSYQTIDQKLDHFIKKFEVEKKSWQGGVIAIIQNGHVIYQSAFGHTKGRRGALITTETLFPLASISKFLSAAAVMLQVDRGYLQLDEPFQFSCLKYPVTLKNILSHTTGYQFPGNCEIEKGVSRAQLLKILKHQKPTRRPGHGYRYSNTLFSLIQDILTFKGISFQEAIQDLAYTLNTLGIQTLPLPSDLTVAHPHLKIDPYGTFKTLPLPRFYPQTVPAAAGVFASLDGMIAFFKFCFGYRPDLISTVTVNKLFNPIAQNRDIERWSNIPWPCPRNKIQSNYGLGCRILTALPYPNEKLICHSGYLSGISTFIGFIPSKDIGIIVLANQNSGISLKKGIEFWTTVIKETTHPYLRRRLRTKKHHSPQKRCR
ncbi:MAG: Beta-lactamase AmpC (Class C) [candidate division TM6 bacterium GW2011_GWE2_42_60]|nr:MAG: Beta-lactamase AmpC (Class C) [candidate division TM6 bacterium GW2011_GWE2_42_60]HBY05369.1 hypothetical protein [Candidatus Dependentiae bacterium]